jgi:hypothetical protein
MKEEKDYSTAIAGFCFLAIAIMVILMAIFN